MLAYIYEEPFSKGNHIILNPQNQKITKSQLEEAKIHNIGTIIIQYNYEAHGYLCKKEANTNEIVRLYTDEIESFSLDRQTCEMVNDMTDIECVEFINQNIHKSKPLNCADHYQLEHDKIGYNIPDHLCALARKHFHLTPGCFRDN